MAVAKVVLFAALCTGTSLIAANTHHSPTLVPAPPAHHDSGANTAREDLPLPDGRTVLDQDAGWASPSLPEVQRYYQAYQALEEAKARLRNEGSSEDKPPQAARTLHDLDAILRAQLLAAKYYPIADFQPIPLSKEQRVEWNDLLPQWLHRPALPNIHLPNVHLPNVHLPTYIPGFTFSSYVNRPPTPLPHVPSPAEVANSITSLLQDALNQLYRKQEVLVELLSCACPRPAQCEGLFTELVTFQRPVLNVTHTETSETSTTGQSAQQQHSPPAQHHKPPVPPIPVAGSGVGIYAGLTYPDGEGPAFTFVTGQGSNATAGTSNSTSFEVVTESSAAVDENKEESEITTTPVSS